MGKELRIICDCCKREITPDQYYIKLNPNYLCRGKGSFRQEKTEAQEKTETFEWYICDLCLAEIGKRVAEEHTVDFEVSK